ncbi:hypothetical protein [Streptomyces odontomachi]|uniref:hypothetical protein n=1 Tax=Streptomyces odontomachi TaxID=2944940 RepID=UPI00210E7C2E|nr:hypothetical protein [Streptomyces sp. ODS25]
MRDPRSALAETLRRIDSSLEDGRSRADVLDLDQLSADSGEPHEVVTTLLDGGQPPAEDIAERIIRRIEHLRATRRRSDGSPHSYEEIASSYGATRASLSNLVRKKTQGTEQRTGRSGGPLASTQAGVETFFFGQPNGWLSADPASALNDALQPVLNLLRSTAGSEPYSDRRAVALRSAAALPDDQFELLEDVIAGLVRQAREERRQQR